MAVGLSVIDYGIGNIQSVLNACRHAGAEPLVAASGAALLDQAPDRIVLPGVGAVGEAIGNLRRRGLDTALGRKVLEEKTPFLGICVGMQLLGDICEEFGEHEGLGWIPGRVERLAAPGSGLRLPHVGWNTIDAAGEDELFDGLDGAHFYFQHSYAMRCDDAFVTARSDYGGRFVSAVRRGHIAGVQFHPEKSSGAGQKLLGAFLAP